MTHDMQTSTSGDAAQPASPQHAVDFAQLRSSIRTLVTLEPSEAPVLSCYLDVQAGARQALDRRRGILRPSLPPSAWPDFDEAVERVDAFLGSELLATTRGIAAFARGGSQPFFLPIQLQVPVPVRVSIDATPSVYELVELKDTYHRYVVMITTEDEVRILEITLGAVTQELWQARPEVPQDVGRKWAREHYQNHRRDRADRFVQEKLEILDRLMARGGHSHLILAGAPSLTAMVLAALPSRLVAKLIDIVPAAASANTADVVAATIASFVAHEERESMTAAALLVQELQRNGLAVAGTAPTLEALQRGQVDMLVMAAAYQPPPGWRCQRCGAVDVRPDRLASACWRCGSEQASPVNVKDEMVKLSERHGATFELVRDSDALMELGGVGCLQRYSWSWRPGPA
jgi:hypothetical protein